jgi:hypothetical protein
MLSDIPSTNPHAIARILIFTSLGVAFTIYVLALVEEGIKKSYRGAGQRCAH